jgi:competence protein ComEC
MLLYLVAGWLTGIALSTWIVLPIWAWGSLATATLIAFVVLRSQLTARFVFGITLMVCLGAGRMAITQGAVANSDVSNFNGTGPITLEGMIIDAPQVRDALVTFRLRVDSIELDSWQPATGIVQVQTPNVAMYRFGDVVKVRGELTSPPADADSYRDYLARQGIHSLMRYTNVEPTGERRGSPIRAALLDFREQAHSLIMRMLPDPQASLLAGILLGIESGISPDVRDAFNAVSATHVIAISGSNLAIIGALVLGISGRFLRPNFSAAVTIAVIMLYTVFVGGDPAVLRAAVMTTLGLIATQLGRETYGLASISFAALLLTAINPQTLFDVGFQLSFMATLGLIVYATRFQTWLMDRLASSLKTDRAQQFAGSVVSLFAITCAAQIAVTPLIAYQFGRFSLFSLPVSLLIVPAQEMLMILGGLSVLIGLVFFPLGQVLAWGSWVFLTWTISIVKLFASLPNASFETALSLPVMIAIYLVLFGFTLLAIQPEAQRAHWFDMMKRSFSLKAMGITGIVGAVVLFSAAGSMPDSRFHFIIMDVGQGAASLIETPTGRHILIDAGGSGRQLSAALGSAMPFWNHRLDLVILTQPTEVHTSGLSTLLQHYSVETVVTNGHHGSGDLSAALWNSLREAHEIIATPGMQIMVEDGVQITILQADSSLDDPGDPLVIRVTYGNLSILIPGDLTPDVQVELIAKGFPLVSQILVAPRGGHRETNSEAFLTAVTPSITIISPTSDNLPHEESLERLNAIGSTIYRTDEQGSIQVTSDGQQLWITTTR